MTRLKTLIAIPLILLAFQACLQNGTAKVGKDSSVITGAQQTEQYIHLLKDKNVGLVANHGSLIGSVHLADTLLSMHIMLSKVFAPEHGLRGQADAGQQISNGLDPKTGIPVISLYGSNKKPSQADLAGVDVILFDLQDVGVRFYTYISTLSYVMEAAAESKIPVIVLDRPNPNGFYIDGPVMESCCTSFVGMHHVPVVYGMTIGEYAMMVNGEGWLAGEKKCDLVVIPLGEYDRNKIYALPVRPSPNLPSWQSVYLYPSLCLFEGTIMSVGRGTEFPFSVFGHPDYYLGSFAFKPHSMPGATHPKLEGETCYGQNLMEYATHYNEIRDHFNLDWIISAYQVTGADTAFFNPYFEKLAGNIALRQQIMQGMSQEEIKAGWQKDLEEFKTIRKKYLIYNDFE